MDIDECTMTYPCSQRCINTHGSFHCLCVDGFEINPNNPTICKSTSGMALVSAVSVDLPFSSISYLKPDAYVVCPEFDYRSGALSDLC